MESTLAVLKAPPTRTFDALNNAFLRFNKSANRWDPVLGGHSATLYSTNEDLVLLKQPEQSDRFTEFAERYLAFLFVVRSTHLSTTKFLHSHEAVG